MVLKYLTKDEKTGRAEWNYLDNIAYAQIYRDEKGRKVVNFRIIGLETTSIPIDECAYLLNDNGKTIDTIQKEE